MIVKNPTDSEIHVVIDGIQYVIPAGKEIDNVPEKHARHWQNNVHSFIEITQDGATKNTEDEEKVSVPAKTAVAKKGAKK